MLITLFIAYSTLDNDKAKLIESSLKDHPLFKASLIGNEGGTLQLLSDKIVERLKSSDYVIPILTEKSKNTQWINQEIGYAYALPTTIIPIVQKDIIKNLDGFIHSNMDLPYQYETDEDKGVENADFLGVFFRLIKHIEDNLEWIEDTTEKETPKSLFDSNLELLKQDREKQNFAKRIKNFIHSSEGVKEAKDEIQRMFEDAQRKADTLIHSKLGLPIGMETETFLPGLIFRLRGFSFSIEWTQRWDNDLDESILVVKYWKGHPTFQKGRNYAPSESPKIVTENQFNFSKDENFENIWLNAKDQFPCKSDYIVDVAIKWVTDRDRENQEERNNSKPTMLY